LDWYTYPAPHDGIPDTRLIVRPREGYRAMVRIGRTADECPHGHDSREGALEWAWRMRHVAIQHGRVAPEPVAWLTCMRVRPPRPRRTRLA
jgi:hypothetical protein